jgi:putative peptide zinc metalloprotease protein
MSNAPTQPANVDLIVPLQKRADLIVQPMQFGRRTFWSIKDPLSHRFYQLREEEFFLLEQLDGRITFGELKSRFNDRFASQTLADSQLQKFVGMLHAQGLVVADLPDQGKRLFARRQFGNRARVMRSITGILAIRFRGFDPERMLRGLYPLTAWFFSKWCVFGMLLLAVAALTLVTVQFETLQTRLPAFHAFFSLENAVWIVVAIAVSKVLHELGHALACKHFGGECHEMGIMFLVFAPCLYCNVSDAWLMPSKWHRAAIGAGGIYVEMCLASVCTFLWWFSEPGMPNTVCLNIVFVCSVSTLLVNGNPLLRYDGYYILSDILEVPNLRQQSMSIIKQWLSRWAMGTEIVNERMLPHRHRGLLAVYAISAVIYRFFVVAAILWFLHQALEPYGLSLFVHFLAVMLLSGMIVFPFWRGFKVVLHTARGRMMNWPRFLTASAIGGAVIAGIMVVPLPHRISAPALVESRDDAIVYVSVGGRLTKIAEGDDVSEGQPLAWLADPVLEQEIAQLSGEIDVLKVRLTSLRTNRASRDNELADQMQTLQAAIDDLNDRLAKKLQDEQRLIIKSPANGRILPPRKRKQEAPEGQLASWTGRPLDEENLGCHLEAGTTLCHIGSPSQVEAVVVLEQSDVEFISTGQRVLLALDQLPGETVWGTVEQISDSNLDIVAPELIAAGAIPTVMDEQGNARPVNAPYLARVRLDSEHPLLLRGTGTAKIYAPPLSIGSRIKRYLQDTFSFRL